MSHTSRLFAVVALVVAGAVAVSYSHSPAVAQEKEKAPTAGAAKWEYRIVVFGGREGFGVKGGGGVNKVEEELNKLGEDGFEIAFVTATNESARGGFDKGSGSLTPVVYYTLKRAKK